MIGGDDRGDDRGDDEHWGCDVHVDQYDDAE